MSEKIGALMEPPDRRLPLMDEATPEGHCAIEAACVHRCLDERGVPREKDGKRLSLWGRVEAWANFDDQPDPLPDDEPEDMRSYLKARGWRESKLNNDPDWWNDPKATCFSAYPLRQAYQIQVTRDDHP